MKQGTFFSNFSSHLANLAFLLSSFVFFVFLCLSFFSLAKPAFAQSNPCSASANFNTCSWAWNDAIGWLSHNSVDDPETAVFGVHIDESGGTVAGHAWNDLLGYIDFSAVTYDETTGELDGQASILDLGVNGSVSLRGDCTPSCGGYGVAIVGDQVTGFAWNDTIGWINFQPGLGGVEFQSAQNPNVRGWAWNDSYGWIAFRFTDYELDWGVNLNPDATITGYAWGDNVGWIDYDPAGPYPAAPSNSARYDSATGEVTGWAQIVGMGNDGWILMSDNGTIPFATTIDLLTGEWGGYAWNDDLGWIAYSHTFGEVFTSVGSSGPVAPVLETPLDCVDTYTINPTAGLTPALDWNDYSTLDGSTQLNYHIQVDADPLFGAPIIDEVVNSTSSLYSIGLGTLSYNGTYYWRVRVESSNNDWSDWGEIGALGESNCFRTPLHAPPLCDFSMNPAPAIVDQETQFTDLTIAYGGATRDFWDWDYGDGNTQFGSDPIENEKPKHTYTDVGDITVTLRVVDSDGYECTTNSDELVASQLPEFRRVIPR